MLNTIDVLDHGYVKFIESWGSDERIIEAARMSTNKGFQGWGPLHTAGCRAKLDEEEVRSGEQPDPRCAHLCTCGQIAAGDEKLLRYLYENGHLTPFEMAGLTIEVQAPIFVIREWHRHRTQSFNEMSARYTPLPDMNYIPSIERLMMSAKGSNKQAGAAEGSEVMTETRAEIFQGILQDRYCDAQHLYAWALNRGVPKELARIHLPVGRYSRMRACANLRNWLAFLTLRLEVNAQWEIRQYAQIVAEFVSRQFPRTYSLFVEGRKG